MCVNILWCEYTTFPCFQFLVIANKATTNTLVCLSWWTQVAMSIGMMPRNGMTQLLGRVHICLVLVGSIKWFSKVHQSEPALLAIMVHCIM